MECRCRSFYHCRPIHIFYSYWYSWLQLCEPQCPGCWPKYCVAKAWNNIAAYYIATYCKHICINPGNDSILNRNIRDRIPGAALRSAGISVSQQDCGCITDPVFVSCEIVFAETTVPSPPLSHWIATSVKARTFQLEKSIVADRFWVRLPTFLPGCPILLVHWRLEAIHWKSYCRYDSWYFRPEAAWAW